MTWEVRQGHVLDLLRAVPDTSVHCVVTSPPYWGLRDYKVAGQLGLEKTPEAYVAGMVEVFRDVKRVLRKDGTLWMNLGDSYAGSAQGWGKDHQYVGEKQRTNRGSLNQPDAMEAKTGFERPPNYISSRQPSGLKPKDLVGIPWRVALALQADGWYLRSDIIWSKPNPMPESVQDRPTRSHEYLFLLSKSARYFYDAQAIKEPVKDSSLKRVAQSTFYEQEGGQKTKEFYHQNPNRSCRQALEHVAATWGRTPSGWQTGPGAHGKEKVGRYKPVVFGGIKTSGYGTRRYSGKIWAPNMSGNASKNTRTVEYPLANKRSVWEISTQPFPDAHFATFPEKLVEPCIRAGTSEQGCCARCGAPWEREVKTTFIQEGVTRNRGTIKGNDVDAKSMTMGDGGKIGHNEVETIGWHPPCSCQAEAIPATVLDPFAGSGTTGVVALKLGRSFLGIELNPRYVAMAQRRIGEVMPLFEASVGAIGSSSDA